MKSTSGGMQLFVHLVQGVGTNQTYKAFKRHTVAQAMMRDIWFAAHLCTSPIIYKAKITVIKPMVSGHSP